MEEKETTLRAAYVKPIPFSVMCDDNLDKKNFELVNKNILIRFVHNSNLTARQHPLSQISSQFIKFRKKVVDSGWVQF